MEIICTFVKIINLNKSKQTNKQSKANKIEKKPTTITNKQTYNKQNHITKVIKIISFWIVAIWLFEQITNFSNDHHLGWRTFYWILFLKKTTEGLHLTLIKLAQPCKGKVFISNFGVKISRICISWTCTYILPQWSIFISTPAILGRLISTPDTILELNTLDVIRWRFG